MDDKKAFLKLQNGSDIRGVAIEGVNGEPQNLTEDTAARIGRAFVEWYCKKSGKQPADLTIGIGRDSRISGPALSQALLSGILNTGAQAADCGLASTPSMFMSILYPQTGFDASIMVTASHLPYNRNGMKFFDKDGGLEKADITAILELAAAAGGGGADGRTPTDRQPPDYNQPPTDRQPPDSNQPPQSVRTVDLISLYAADLREKIKAGVQAENYDMPLAGLHIVVDAGNGTGGFFAEQILKPLGADTDGSQFLTPDGMFPNHIPNPENKTAMAAIRKATLENAADLGLIFDTDVDRMSAVAASGREINRDEIIALMAAILAPDYPGSTIVTDSVTSDRLTAFLEQELGLKHLRYMRGYKNVINKCRELNANGIVSPLAMETSGHGAMKENHYLDDGAYQAVRLVCALAKAKRDGREIETLIEKMSTEFADKEIRIKIDAEDYKAYGANMLKQFARNAEKLDCEIPDSYEGVRLSFHNREMNGWMLLRASLHDPVLVLNIEGKTRGDLEKLEETAAELMRL